MRLGKVVKLTVFILHLLQDGQTDPDVSWPDLLWPNVSWTGRFVSGRFRAGQSETGRFVGLPMKIFLHMPYALR